MNRVIWQWCFLVDWSEGEDATTATQKSTSKRLVAMEPWTGAQRAFAVKAFYKNGDSFVIAQREFRREFGIHRNRAFPL
jgi:hypothetical protein